MGNDLPAISDPSGAFLSRITTILFPHSNAGKEDRTLAARLRPELPGVLNRLIAAWRERRDRRWAYLEPHPIAAAKGQADLNPLDAFWHEVVIPAPENAFRGAARIDAEWLTTGTDLYLAYTDWAVENGRGKLSRQKMLNALAFTPYALKAVNDDQNRRGYACKLHRGGGRHQAGGPRVVPVPGMPFNMSTGGGFFSSPPAPEATAAPASAAMTPTAGYVQITPEPQPDPRAEVLGAACAAAASDPALSRLTPRFWDLVGKHGVWAPRPQPVTEHDIASAEAAASTHAPDNPFAAMGARTRLLERGSAYTKAEAALPSQVMLAELAAAVGLPTLHARGYLRSVSDRLDALGIRLLERRTAEVGIPGADGDFVPPPSKGGAQAAKARAKSASKDVTTARRALAAAGRSKKSPEEIAALEGALSGATERAEATAAHKRNVSSRPPERHGFAVLIAPRPNPSDE